MIVYFSVLTFLFFSAVVTFDGQICRWRRSRFAVAGVNAVFLAIFIGLRDQVGGDWESYVAILDYFRRPITLTSYLLHPMEPGYLSLDLLSNWLNGGIYLVNLLCAVLIVVFLMKYSSLLSINPNYVFFIAGPYILFVVGMNYSRQSVAIAISFVALAYLATGNSRRFYQFACLAVCFHFTAAILILFVRFKRKVYSVLLLGGMALIGLFISIRYPLYLQGNEYLDSKGVWLRLILLLTGGCLFFIQRSHWKTRPDAYWVLRRASLFVFVLAAASFKFSTIADRLGLYFMFLYVTTMAALIPYSPRPFRGLGLSLCAAVSYAFFFVWFGLSSAAELWIPYKSIIPQWF